MGRSVDYDSDAIAVAYVDGSDIQDSFEFDEYIESVQDYVKELWPSFDAEDRWIGRELRLIAENSMAYIAVSEYCGLISLSLVPKTEQYLNSYYSDEVALANLTGAWTARIAPKFMKSFNQFNRLGSFSNGESVYQRVS